MQISNISVKMAEMGAMMEHDVFGYLDEQERSSTIEYLVESIRRVGVGTSLLNANLVAGRRT